MPPVKEILSNMGKTCRFVTKTNLSTTVSSFQTSIIALLTGCLPVSVRYDLSAMTLYLITQNYWKCGSHGVKLMTLPCMAIEVYKCGNNINPQYLNEMFTLKKCRCDLRDNPLQESQQHDLQIMVSNPLKAMVPKYGTYCQQHIKWERHLIHSKTWSKLGLDQPANVVSAVCLQLDFPIISMYDNLTNHNRLLCWTGVVD